MNILRGVGLRLLIGFVAVVVVGVGTVAIIANQATTSSFHSFVTAGGNMYAGRLATVLAEFYALQHSWQGVDELTHNVMRTTDQRLIVADANNRVVGDSQGLLLGHTLPPEYHLHATSIEMDGKPIGSLILTPNVRGPAGIVGQGPGAGGRGGPRLPPGALVLEAGSLERSFLEDVNRGLLLGALAATLLALALSLLLTRQILRPLSQLQQGASRLAAGDLAHRVDDSARDEFGDVSRSFNAMAASLEKNERDRRQLLADIAHDLRTPLTVIEGTADGMIDGVLPADERQFGIIRDEARQLARLINDLRELSVADAGQLRLQMQPLDLAELVERVTANYAAEAETRGINLTARRSGALPLLNLDGDRIYRAVANLLSNALRHTAEGGSVTVTVGAAAGSAGMAQISVSDNGEGIDAEDLPYVFDRFYRADKSRSRRSGGSGLGLAIVRQLVEAHGGTVSAVSTRGEGSTFSIQLPTRHPNTSASA